MRTIEWQAPEYNHTPRTADFFWAIGLVTLMACGIALYFANYVFAVFILISGACLILFTIREPENMNFIIETEGLTIGKDKYEWKDIKSFNIKKSDKGQDNAKLLIETSKYFLPIYTIPVPSSLLSEVSNSLLKIIPKTELQESHSMLFAEKLGF